MKSMTVGMVVIVMAGCAGPIGPTSRPTTTTRVTADEPASRPAALSRQERVLGLVRFYAASKQHFAYFDRCKDLDWDQAFMDFLPQVEAEQTTLEYYRVLQRFAALLQDGHTEVYLPEAEQKRLDRLPIILGYVEDRYVVLERYPAREILQKDIPPGSVLLAVEGMDPETYFQSQVFPYTAAGSIWDKRSKTNWRWAVPKDTQVAVTLRYPDGCQETFRLPANRRSVKWTEAAAEKYLLPWHRDPQFAASFPADGILHVRYGRCDKACLKAFSSLVASLDASKVRGMILDLRGNSGGSTPAQTIRELIAKPIDWYQCRTRWSASYIEAQTQTMNQEAKAAYLKQHGLPERFGPEWMDLTFEDSLAPAERHYDGPLVILTDISTGSAAEDLAVMLHGCGRATVVGERSAGSTGQPLFVDLPGGGQARICTVQCRYADGREFVGPGIQPDIPVTRTIQAIAEGRDEVLQAAIDYLHSVLHGPTSHPSSD